MPSADVVQSNPEETRYGFGRNWKRFAAILNPERIANAERSLAEMLKIESLNGKRFLDAGCGSGLYSLAAQRLGASVHSFDYDIDSVECTDGVRKKFGKTTENWSVEQGSVLDEEYLESLGSFDVVYSWGVLHHTGEMWKALELIHQRVAAGGKLFIAIYNHQRNMSGIWWHIKRLYCQNIIWRSLIILAFVPYFVLSGVLVDLLRRKNPLKRYKEHRKKRGMSKILDWLDWLGGFPFETATPDEIVDFYLERGFRLEKLITLGGDYGCNEFVFSKQS